MTQDHTSLFSENSASLFSIFGTSLFAEIIAYLLSGNTTAICINKDPEISENWVKFNKSMNRNLINEICSRSEFINSILGKEKNEIAEYLN